MAQYGQYDVGTNNQGGGQGGGYSDGGGIRITAIPGALFRQMVWAIPLLVLLAFLSFWFTKGIKRQYIAEGRILVQLGSEYVYNPTSGNSNFNSPLSITSDQVVLTEIGIIKNSAIMDQVINQMISSPTNGGVGGERFAPKLYEKWVKANTTNKIDRWNNLVKSFDTSYAVIPKPKSSIVDLTFKHPDGEVAVKTLDALMTTYENFRKEKFVIAQTGQVAERRADTEEQLATIEAKIQSILNKNAISEFKSEQAGVQKRAEELRTQLNGLTGRLAAAEAALAAGEDQLRALSPTIDLYVDDRASQRLAQAQLEKRQLLAKYLPTSNPVRAKEAEIRELQTHINNNGGKATGGRRVGPNPVYQTLLTQRNTYQATADSLREQEVTLQKQVNAAIAKVKRMRQLAPRYTNLVREKATVESRLKSLQARETEALIDEKQLENSSENIKFITRPTIPRKGRNMRKILFALALLGSVFSVFMLALLRVFLDPRIYGPGSQSYIHQPTAPMPTEVYYDNNIPEAVPGGSPHVEPVPAYAPVAYGGETYGEDSYGQDIYEQKTYAPSPYGEPAPVEYVHPNTEKVFADGSSANANSLEGNPYTTTAEQPFITAQPYAAAQPYVTNVRQTEYAGPEGNIPVLGQTSGGSEPNSV